MSLPLLIVTGMIGETSLVVGDRTWTTFGRHRMPTPRTVEIEEVAEEPDITADPKSTLGSAVRREVVLRYPMEGPFRLTRVPDATTDVRGVILRTLDRAGAPPEVVGRMTEDLLLALDAYFAARGDPGVARITSPQPMRGVPHV